MRRLPIVFVLLALVLSACSGDDDQADTTSTAAATTTTAAPAATAGDAGDPAPTTTQAPAEDGSTTEPAGGDGDSWTFLVYLMGDTDLEPFAVQDMLEMAAVGSTDEVNIVALVDRHPEFSDEAVLNLPDWEDTRLLEVGTGQFTELAAQGELNLGSPETFAAFIETGITSYPADHYAVVLWDHGAGWPGMGPDESDGLDVLDMADLGQGLAQGLEGAGVDKIDMIGFDACLMATYEVASIVAPYADYMLSSQELEPGHGWNYEALALLTENPDATPVDLGRAIIDGFAAQAEASDTGVDITLSLLDLSYIDELQAALGGLTAEVTAAPTEAAPALAGARNAVLSFGRNPDPDLDSNLTDLGGLLDLIGKNSPDVAQATAAARAVLADMVVTVTNGPATANASGLSIYFPAFQRDFRQGYLFLEGVPHWPDALAAFYQAGDAIPVEEQPEIVEEATPDQDAPIYYFDEDGLNVEAYFDLAAEDTVVGATIFYGLLDEEEELLYYIGEEPAHVFAGGLVYGLYDLTVFTISDGEDTAPAFFGLSFDQDTGFALVDVPLAYQAPGSEEFEDVVLSLVADPEDGTVVEEGFYLVDESGTWGALTADPQGLIYPIVLAEDADGNQEWTVTTEVGLWADLPLLQYNLEPLDSGTTVYLELTVFDYGGNEDEIAVFDAIP